MEKKFNEQLTELMNKLKIYTLSYLDELGIKVINGKVQCLNPDHPDKNPSMSYWAAHNILHCFSCNASYNIFHIANIKENKPLYGKQFILENVFYLAKKFNEPYQHINIEISPEEKAKFRKMEIMRLLSDYVTSKLNKSYLSQRKISIETALKLNIGSVISYNDLLQKYINNGFTEQEINQLGIVKKRINENKLIFIIKNIHGQPVSFVSREMVFTIENAINYIGFDLKEYKALNTGQLRQDFLYAKCNGDQNKINFVTHFLNTGKYENGTDSEIYSKKSIFYLYSDIKKEINSFEPVLIVEGYIDAVTAYQKGFRNIIALGSASFTQEHLNIIENSKEIRFPAITFDQDTTGIKRTQALVDRIKEHGNIRKKFFIAKYKEKGKDIDEILNLNVVKNFNEIFEYETLFQYSVSNLLENGLSENEIVEQMIPLIIQEPSPLKQSELAGELEKKLNTINKHTITAEIEYRLNNVKQQMSEMVLKIVDNTKKKIVNNPESSTAFLQQAIEDIEASSIKGKKHKNIFALTEENIALDEEKKRDASRYNINFGLPIINSMQVTPGKTITVAAKPNIGKTSFFVNLAKDILTLNNNTVIYYYTTDDSRSDIKNNLIAVLSGLPRQYVSDPIHNKDYGLNSTNIHKIKMMATYNEANALVESWVRQKRLAILHSSDGVPDWTSFEKTLKYDLSQDKELENTVKILIIDSVNKIEVEGIINGNERAEYLSEHTKKSATKYDLVVFQNYEIRKADKSQKINLSMLAGTRRIEYDSDAIITLHQPLHELANLANTKWKKPNLEWDLPVLIAEIEKTKIGGNKNESFFHKLDGFTNTLTYNFDFNTLSALRSAWFEDLKMYKKIF